MATSLRGQDIFCVEQFTQDEITLIIKTAAQFESALRAGKRLMNMIGKVLATVFYEPSARTRLSFETAMLRLGGQVISVADAASTSSAAKGETLFDTGKMIESYCDVAVIRHPVVGSAQALAEGASVPVINGGDGAGQHPTQALLDLYAIGKEVDVYPGAAYFRQAACSVPVHTVLLALVTGQEKLHRTRPKRTAQETRRIKRAR